MKTYSLILCLIMFLFLASKNIYASTNYGIALSGLPCKGELKGTLDYTSAADRNSTYYKQIVSSHFPPKVEQLRSGNRGYLFGDINYTLERIPNHHRALYSMMRYQLQKKITSAQTPIECYFQKAIIFKPDDIKIYLLYANYLKKKNHLDLAIKQYKKAISYQPELATLHNGIGQLYFKIKNYNQALHHAHKAYEYGYKQKSLMKKLKAANKWSAP